MNNKQTILVTGGAGFIGSHLCERLARDGHHVISLDNYFTGSRDNHVAGVEYREGHTKDIETLIPETPDLIYHLGEYSRVEKSFEDTDKVWDFNILGTFAVLEFCKKRGSKIVYAGSSTKFAAGGFGRDQSPYAWAKASNTELVKNYGAWFGVPYAITYFYNVYGGRERGKGPYATLIGIFKEQYKSGEPLTVVLPGTQSRNFTHVEDTVQGLVLAGEKGHGDEYGIGSDNGYSVSDIAKFFDSEVLYLPERQGNRQDSPVDNAKLKALGWIPKKNVKEHIEEFKKQIPRGAKRERRILVFSTTFHPIAGPAEKSLVALMQKMPELHFDIITTIFSKEAKNIPAPVSNATVYRVGFGIPFDKYLLPFFGARQALRLIKEHVYLFEWSIMASYAALAARAVRRRVPLPLLLTLADQSLMSASWYVWLLIRSILGSADQVYATTNDQEKAALSISERAEIQESLGSGDAFSNAIRFAYSACLREELKKNR